MRFSKFSPFSATKAKRSFATRSRFLSSGKAFFAVDRSNFIAFVTTFQTNEANDWSCVLVKLNDSGRVAYRLFDPAGTTIGTVVDLGGYAGLAPAVNANATIVQYTTCRIVGSIANTQGFSADLTDKTFFQGAKG